MTKVLLLVFVLTGIGCSRFQAERVDAETSDQKALDITDNWVLKDTEKTVGEIIKQMKGHRGYKDVLRSKKRPAIFIAEIQNLTSESYFPITDFNEELLTELSLTGDFVLVDERARKRILEEINYQNGGAVDPKTAKKIGKQTGADLLIFGNVHMKPESRKGKTIKQYSVNIRMTNLETATEVLRTRAKIHKYSNSKKFGW